MDTDVYFFSQGHWFKTKVHLPDAELTGAALADHLWGACGLDPKLLPVFKVSQAAIAENLHKNAQQPVHDQNLTSASLVLNHATYATQKLQPSSLQAQALVVFLPSPWGSTLAGPWVTPPSWAHCERLFSCYDPSENHAFAYDLALACHRIWPDSLPAPLDASQELVHGTNALMHANGTHGLHLFNRLKDGFNANGWVQDAFQAGYGCDFGKRTQTAVALHLPSKPRSPLSTVILYTLPGVLPVCNDVFFAEKEAPATGRNHGGNILVSPPVTGKTVALEAGRAGPAVNEHPPAPLGKLVVGDSKQGSLGPGLRQWLTSQRLQPVLPIDTSWLSVGHVDEVVSFLRAQDESFKVLVADPGMMLRLYDALTPAEQAKLTARYPSVGTSQFQEQNKALQSERLAPIRNRLKVGLALDDRSFIPIPVGFVTSAEKSTAHTVNLVNLQLINGHALVPKPFGPRVEPQRASAILEKLGIVSRRPGGPGPGRNEAWQKKEAQMEQKLKGELMKQLQDLGGPGVQQMKIQMKESVGYWIWARKDTLADQLAKEHACSQEELRKHEHNAQKFAANGALQAGPTGVNRVWIPSDDVDVLESYMEAVLEPLGFTVHFIDTSAYHGLHGELHSGSNAQRALPTDWTLDKCQQLWSEMSLLDLSYRVA